MCISQSNTSKADIEAVEELISKVESDGLKAVLGIICKIVREGGVVCFGEAPTEQEPAMPFAPQQQALPPGIYPPNTQQPDVPDKGYGNYL